MQREQDVRARGDIIRGGDRRAGPHPHLPPGDDDDDERKSNRVVALVQEVQFRWLRDVMTGPPEAELTRCSDCSQSHDSLGQ